MQLRLDGRIVVADGQRAGALAQQQAVAAVPQRPGGAVAADARQGVGLGGDGLDGGRLCGRSGQPGAGRHRLVIVDVVLDIDDQQVAAAVGVVIGLGLDENASVLHLQGAQQLHGLVVAAVGGAAEGMVVHAEHGFEPAAVRLHAVEVHRVVAAGMIPTGVEDFAGPQAAEHGRVEIVALVEGELRDILPVLVHHMQHEGLVATALGQRLERRLALVEQHLARIDLAVGTENDPAVGQVGRRQVVAFLGREIAADNAPWVVRPQRLLEIVFIDVPARHLVVVLVLVEQAQREQQPFAVEGRHQILDIALAAGDGRGDVGFAGGDGGVAAHIDIAAGHEEGRVAQVRLALVAILVHRNRPLDEGDGRLEHARIGAVHIRGGITGAGGQHKSGKGKKSVRTAARCHHGWFLGCSCFAPDPGACSAHCRENRAPVAHGADRIPMNCADPSMSGRHRLSP